ncbi:MAG: hypothetical protein WC862_03785 [Patescibacteria group bacterium]
MLEAVHKNLAEGRWFEMSLASQLGNVGSEVNRVVMWRKKADIEKETKAKERALELFDLTLSDNRWKGRFKELTRAREALVDSFYNFNEYNSTLEDLNKYFYYFAYAARCQ